MNKFNTKNIINIISKSVLFIFIMTVSINFAFAKRGVKNYKMPKNGITEIQRKQNQGQKVLQMLSINPVNSIIQSKYNKIIRNAIIDKIGGSDSQAQELLSAMQKSSAIQTSMQAIHKNLKNITTKDLKTMVSFAITMQVISPARLDKHQPRDENVVIDLINNMADVTQWDKGAHDSFFSLLTALNTTVTITHKGEGLVIAVEKVLNERGYTTFKQRNDRKKQIRELCRKANA